jgi:hypothetical protein
MVASHSSAGCDPERAYPRQVMTAPTMPTDVKWSGVTHLGRCAASQASAGRSKGRKKPSFQRSSNGVCIPDPIPNPESRLGPIESDLARQYKSNNGNRRDARHRSRIINVQGMSTFRAIVLKTPLGRRIRALRRHQRRIPSRWKGRRPLALDQATIGRDGTLTSRSRSFSPVAV